MPGITKENLHDAFSYQGLDDGQRLAYAQIQDVSEAFASLLLDLLPNCDDRQAAIRHIFEAKATANRAIAIRGRV